MALLARQDLPYSHVKAVIPSRGNICFDKQMEVFDKVLEEISIFVQPDQNTRLEHARYELKPENFKTLACPVACRLRSFGSLDFAEYMNRAEIYEKKYSHDLPNTLSPWLGYRMYNFDKLYSKRFDSVKGVAALLTQPSFFTLMHHILGRVSFLILTAKPVCSGFRFFDSDSGVDIIEESIEEIGERIGIWNRLGGQDRNLKESGVHCAKRMELGSPIPFFGFTNMDPIISSFSVNYNQRLQFPRISTNHLSLNFIGAIY